MLETWKDDTLQTEKSALFSLSRNPRASTSVSISVHFASLKLKPRVAFNSAPADKHFKWSVAECCCGMAFSRGNSFLRTATLWGCCMEMATQSQPSTLCYVLLANGFLNVAKSSRSAQRASMKMCVSELPSDPELSTLFISVGLFVW